ncbi:MAG: RNA 2',3'-cyclic phosphodiesterase [bacterium]|nr:RNA 2',3'-cyclic phosphodiesterase [bacterium]
MRAFLSINLTPEGRGAIGALQQSLRADAEGVRFTRPESCHLTLKFLGEIEPETEAALVKTLPAVAAAFSPFEIELKGVGQFPPRGPLAVLWVGVERGAAALTALESAIREALDAAGVSYDGKKPFTPHLTIGRGQRGRNAYLRRKESHSVSVTRMTADAFYLMESRLDPTGAIYTERAKFSLTG